MESSFVSCMYLKLMGCCLGCEQQLLIQMWEVIEAFIAEQSSGLKAARSSPMGGCRGLESQRYGALYPSSEAPFAAYHEDRQHAWGSRYSFLAMHAPCLANWERPQLLGMLSCWAHLLYLPEGTLQGAVWLFAPGTKPYPRWHSVLAFLAPSNVCSKGCFCELAIQRDLSDNHRPAKVEMPHL